jgi:hypothetical protein
MARVKDGVHIESYGREDNMEASSVVCRYSPIGREDRSVDFAGFGIVVRSGCQRAEAGLRVEHEAHEKQSRTRDCNRVAVMTHDSLPR